MTPLKLNRVFENLSEFEVELRRDILIGEYIDQELLPSLNELHAITTLSKYALEKCLDQLVVEGLLVKRRAESYRIHRPQRLNHIFESLSSIQNNIEAAGLKASVEVINHEVLDFDPILHLGFTPTTKVLKIEKRYRANDKITLYQICYYPLDLFEALDQKDISHQPIYLIMNRDYGVTLKGATKHLDAIHLTAEKQQLLMTKEVIGSRIYGSIYDQFHHIIEIFDNYAPADLVMYESEKSLNV
jgi:GntR family transcriptional regulator